MLGIALAPILGSPALANPPAEFQSHFYEFVAFDDPYDGVQGSWYTAVQSAGQQVFNDLSGHLATITSAAENDFLFNLVTTSRSEFAGAWIGGKEPDGWIVGPELGQPLAYENWGGIEPNDRGWAYMNIGTKYARGSNLENGPIRGKLLLIALAIL
jgi:hypothetical protein